MNLLTFNAIHISCEFALIFAIYVAYYAVKLKSYFQQVFLLMDTSLGQQFYWQYLRSMILRNQQMESGILKPAYRCDRWFQKRRFCEQWRNVGSTVTFVLARPPPKTVGRVRIDWYQKFRFINGTGRNKTLNYFIDPRDPPWNMVVGAGGFELRVSPITESDILVNHFTAVARFEHLSPTRQLHFGIQIMPTDLGIVYPGDTMTIHMPSYVSLPAESMSYEWQLEAVDVFLPSNMRPSPSGASLTISELRKGQEGIFACIVSTNLGIFATQKRFQIRNVETGNSKLIFIATRPPHKFIPLDEWTKRINPILESLSEIHEKNESSALTNHTDKLDPQHLNKLLSKMPELKKLLNENYNLTLARKRRSPQISENPDYFIEPVDNQHSEINPITGFYLPNEEPNFPFANTHMKTPFEHSETEDGLKLPIDTEGQKFDTHQRYHEPENTGILKPGHLGDFDYEEVARRTHMQTPFEHSETEDGFKLPIDTERQKFDTHQRYHESENTGIPKPGHFGDFDYEEVAPFEQEALDLEASSPQPIQKTKHHSLLEQRKQRIRDRLYPSKSKQKPMKISMKISMSFRGTKVPKEKRTTLPPVQEREKIAMLLSVCDRNSQCSLNADCVKLEKKKPGFCRCRPKFEGNGIFCWENNKYQT